MILVPALVLGVDGSGVEEEVPQLQRSTSDQRVVSRPLERLVDRYVNR